MITMKVLILCTMLFYAFMVHHHHHQVNAITASDETAANQQNTEFDNQKEIEFSIVKMNTKLQVKPVHVFTDMDLDSVGCLKGNYGKNQNFRLALKMKDLSLIHI